VTSMARRTSHLHAIYRPQIVRNLAQPRHAHHTTRQQKRNDDDGWYQKSIMSHLRWFQPPPRSFPV